jgi:hypothetical protein
VNANDFRIDERQLRDAITSIPVVYPPELAFLADTPVQQTAIVRSMLGGPVYAPVGVSFLAFFSEAGGRNFLTLLVTSDSLSRGLDQSAIEFLSEIFKPPRRVGWWERITSQFHANKRLKQTIREMRNRGELSKRQARAISSLYFPVFHDDDIIVAFPEDDFTDDTGRSDNSSFDRALKSSGVKNVCKSIQPLRCGLPKSFCNQLLAAFRI